MLSAFIRRIVFSCAYRAPTMSLRRSRLKDATRVLTAIAIKRVHTLSSTRWSCKMRDERQGPPKQPNAYKHGIFSRTAIVPGEDGEEFEALYSSLIQEWMPDGATEEDAVLSIAKGIWRKRRAQKFIEIRLLKNSHDPGHASHDENLGLIAFMAFLRAKPNVAFEDYAGRCLRADKIQLFKNKFPRSRFKSTEEWANAIINEIRTMLPSETDPGCHAAAQLGLLALSSATFTDGFFDDELRLDERLDVMIDRAVKRLIQTKAMKQMLGQTGSERTDESITHKPSNGRRL